MRKFVVSVFVTAVVAIALTACSGGKVPLPAPTAERVVDVHPEVGYLESIVETADGTATCSAGVLTTKLIPDGTISANGVDVTFRVTDNGATVVFNGGAFSSEAIVNGKPAILNYEDGVSIFRFSYREFGMIDAITFCGGGA